MKTTLMQTNFTAGEMSPRLYGRVDIERYANGAKTLENVIGLVHGGVIGRYGTVYMAGTKTHAAASRLIPFVFNTEQAYWLEFGNLYMRVYLPDGSQVQSGGSPYEIVTPYTTAMLPDIDFTQGADTMIMFHEDVTPQRLRRFADDLWTIGNLPFITPPQDEVGDYFAVVVTLSAVTVGTGRTATAASATWLPSDVGRDITYLGGTATITAYSSTTVVTVEIKDAFSTVTLPSAAWNLAGSPQVDCTPSTKGPVGDTVTLTTVQITYGAEQNVTLQTRTSVFGGEITVTQTVAGHGLVVGDKIRVKDFVPPQYNGIHTVDTVPTANTYTFKMSGVDPGPDTTLGKVQKLTQTSQSGWRASDVGKFVSINGGLVKIVTYISGNTVSGTIYQELSATEPAPENAWILLGSILGGVNGYPRCGTFYQQRLWMAGLPGLPQACFGSRIASYYDFETGVADTDAVAFTVASDRIEPIRHLTQNRALLVLTYGGEFTINGGDQSITPTNIQVVEQTPHGCTNTYPAQVGNETFFVQRAGRKIRAIAPDKIDSLQYGAPDLSVLAEHITLSGVKEMAYQAEPDPLLWVVLNNGKLITCTIDRDQNVVGWTGHVTDGLVESVACIPASDGDRVAIIVQRTINSVTKRYVERIDPSIYMDSTIIGTSGPGTATWGGLSHLEAKTVKVKADGVAMIDRVVTAGSITIERTANAIEIGLGYTPKVIPLTPEVAGPTGTSQGRKIRVSRVTARMRETIGMSINGKPVSFRQFGAGILDAPPTPFTGDKEVPLLGWEDGEIDLEITQPQPYPFHLQALILEFNTSN